MKISAVRTKLEMNASQVMKGYGKWRNAGIRAEACLRQRFRREAVKRNEGFVVQEPVYAMERFFTDLRCASDVLVLWGTA